MSVSQDMIRREMMRTPDGPETLIIPLIIEIVRYGHTVCPYIIIEGIFKGEWYSEMFEQLVTLHEGKVLASYFELTFEETIQSTKPEIKLKNLAKKRCTAGGTGKIT